MRAIFSYGLALIIVLVIAVWLATGVLVIGGKGPGNGEKPVVSVIAGDTALTLEQQALAAELDAKSQAAKAAKKASDEADAAAKKAAAELSAARSAEAEKALSEEVDAKTKAAEEAKAKADAAAAASEAAAEAADEARLKLDAAKTIAERNDAQGNGTDTTPRSVRIMSVVAQPLPIEVPLRGRTKAKSSVSVVALTTGTVEKVNVEKGQAVKAGDVICVLDKGARQLAVGQAEAGMRQAQQAYDANAALRAKGLAPVNSEAGLAAALKGAQAGLENAQLELGRTEIKTEVAGIVQDPLASVGNMLAAGSPCATVVQLDPMLFIASVPEAKVGYAKIGLPATVTTVTGETVEGKVTYIASTANEDTRSFAVEIELPNADGKLRDGVTAEASVKVTTTLAHLLPQSVLTLDDAGTLGIRTVEAGNKVAFHAVNIVRDTREGVWIVGLPLKINVITVGQEFVQPGQVVDARTADGAQPS